MRGGKAGRGNVLLLTFARGAERGFGGDTATVRAGLRQEVRILLLGDGERGDGGENSYAAWRGGGLAGIPFCMTRLRIEVLEGVRAVGNAGEAVFCPGMLCTALVSIF